MPEQTATRHADPVVGVLAPIAELVRVRLLRAVEVSAAATVTDDWGTLPTGSWGTVVGCYPGGQLYEVEFTDPFHAVVTLPRAALSA